MTMRTDCRHYARRTSVAGEVVEACRLGAAPDAPYACPDNCPLFEKVKVSRAGWTVGSLGAPEATANQDRPVDDSIFVSLASEFDPETVAAIEAEESRRHKGRPWWKRKKR